MKRRLYATLFCLSFLGMMIDSACSRYSKPEESHDELLAQPPGAKVTYPPEYLETKETQDCGNAGFPFSRFPEEKTLPIEPPTKTGQVAGPDGKWKDTYDIGYIQGNTTLLVHIDGKEYKVQGSRLAEMVREEESK